MSWNRELLSNHSSRESETEQFITHSPGGGRAGGAVKAGQGTAKSVGIGAFK